MSLTKSAKQHIFLFMPTTSPQALKWYEDPKALKDARKKYGVTQTELAKRAGVKLSLIANIESGRRRLTKDVQEPLWGAINDIHKERQAALAGAQSDVDRWLQSVEHERLKHPDFDETIRNAPHMAQFAYLVPPKDPKALEAWKASTAKRFVENKAAVARQFGSYENFEHIMASAKRIAGLEAEVAAQAEQIAALRDLLDLKTKEVLLRDKIEGEQAPASTELAEKPKDD